MFDCSRLEPGRPIEHHCCRKTLAGRSRCNVRQRDISDLDILVAPLVEQLHSAHLRLHLLGQNLPGSGGVFDLDFPVVGHDGRRIHLLSTEGWMEATDGVVRRLSVDGIDRAVGRLKCSLGGRKFEVRLA